MGARREIDKEKLSNLITGMLSIYILYGISGVLHERLLKYPYIDMSTGLSSICEYPFGLMLIPNLIAWIMALGYLKFVRTGVVRISEKSAALTGFAAASASFCSLLAIKTTSFPVIMMMESSSVLPVVFVAVFCSRVSDVSLKLGPHKLIVAAATTAGILLFELSDSDQRQRETKAEVYGLLFVVGFLVADGFLPDLQAYIKIRWKPEPVEMMAVVNKWATLYMFIGMLFLGHGLAFLRYLFYHPRFLLELLGMSVLSGFGQFFIYRMIKQFKQHLVPFTIASRKILTVIISIFFVGHDTNFLQLFSILIVMGTLVIEFFIEISRPAVGPNAPSKAIEFRGQMEESASLHRGYSQFLYLFTDDEVE